MNTDIDLLTERVLGAIVEVSNTLGCGFLEKVYARALLRELCLRGIRATSQASFTAAYNTKAAQLENTSPISSSKTRW
jgi:GxxExxY protein